MTSTPLPPAPTPPSSSPSVLAAVALGLGIACWLIFGLTASIPGVIVAKIELRRIDRGESPAAGRSFARAGFWLCLVNVVVVTLVLAALCVVFALFGWAFLEAPGRMR